MDNLAGLAALLSLVFALTVGARWITRRRLPFACWGVGLLIFAAAAAAQSFGESHGFADHVTVYRLFYLLGGALGVVYLALGTLYLMAPRRVAHAFALVLAAFTVVVAIDAFAAPIDPAKLTTAAGILGAAYRNAIPLQVAVVTFNIVGTVIFAGGAAWSGWRFIRRRAGLERIVSNVLLTAGALVVAAGFSAAKAAGATSIDPLGGYEAVGVALMFAGFLAVFPVRATVSRESNLPSAAARAR